MVANIEIYLDWIHHEATQKLPSAQISRVKSQAPARMTALRVFFPWFFGKRTRTFSKIKGGVLEIEG